MQAHNVSRVKMGGGCVLTLWVTQGNKDTEFALWAPCNLRVGHNTDIANDRHLALNEVVKHCAVLEGCLLHKHSKLQFGNNTLESKTYTHVHARSGGS